jgi:hypothetical protein
MRPAADNRLCRALVAENESEFRVQTRLPAVNIVIRF